MSEALWVTGDTLSTLSAMPDSCVDLVMTSPPFLALRSYLPADDPNKGHEIGQEATPGEFLDVLLDITEECARVLAPHGSLCVELGDTYSGSGGAGGDYNADGLREGQQAFSGSAQKRARLGGGDDYRPSRSGRASGWPLDKSLCMIPELYRFALAYGMNPLTGRTTEPWRVRNVVRWCRPNPPVGALGDKFRPGTSDLVVACKSARRWFDLDAVREVNKPERMDEKGPPTYRGITEGGERTNATYCDPAGAPPLDWWEIPTAPYKGSHYATFPPALVVRPVKAMCPLEVCTTCHEPRRRLQEENPDYEGRAGGPTHNNDEQGASLKGFPHKAYPERRWTPGGFTDCGHGTFRPGRVLDPFGGSGTTLAVATGHGRDAIGIDLDVRNADQARDRVGMWLTEVTVDELADRLAAPQVVPT